MIHRSSPVILDVAHNPDGILHLIRMIDHEYPGRTLRFVLGLSKNKDLLGCLTLLAARGSYFHLVEAENGRGASLSVLREQLSILGVAPPHIFIHNSISHGVFEAEQHLSKEELLVICGSFFIMSEVRKALGIDEPSDLIDLNERYSETERPRKN